MYVCVHMDVLCVCIYLLNKIKDVKFQMVAYGYKFIASTQN